MAESHVVSGLVAKHTELNGLMQFHQLEIKRIAEGISHLNSTIKLFSPDFDLRSIKSKRTNARNQYFEHGETQRVVLTVLRGAQLTMSSREITDILIQSKAIEPSVDNVTQIQKNVLACLSRLEKQGVVTYTRNRGLLHWQAV